MNTDDLINNDDVTKGDELKEYVVNGDDIKRNEGDPYKFTHQMEVVDGEMKRVPIPQSFSLNACVRRIGNHNARAQYTGVMLLGQSGSGKSTLSAKIIELLEKQGFHYKTHWLDGLNDFKNFDQKIQTFPKGVPNLIVFSDMSMVTELLNKTQMARIAYQTTTVRHITKSKTIVLYQIHYSKALQKFFRNQHFTFLTSLGSEEHSNLTELFGKHNVRHLNSFGKNIRRQMVNGQIVFPQSSNTNDWLRYVTDKPFRVALVDEMGWVHNVLYSRPLLDLEHGNGKYLTAKELVHTVKSAYGLSYGGTMLRVMAMIYGQTGDMALSPDHRKAWRMARKIAAKTDVDWEKVLEEVDKTLKFTHKKHGWYKKEEQVALDKMDEIMAPRKELTKKLHLQHEIMGPPDVIYKDNIPQYTFDKVSEDTKDDE